MIVAMADSWRPLALALATLAWIVVVVVVGVIGWLLLSEWHPSEAVIYGLIAAVLGTFFLLYMAGWRPRKPKE